MGAAAAQAFGCTCFGKATAARRPRLLSSWGSLRQARLLKLSAEARADSALTPPEVLVDALAGLAGEPAAEAGAAVRREVEDAGGAPGAGDEELGDGDPNFAVKDDGGVEVLGVGEAPKDPELVVEGEGDCAKVAEGEGVLEVLPRVAAKDLDAPAVVVADDVEAVAELGRACAGARGLEAAAGIADGAKLAGEALCAPLILRPWVDALNDTARLEGGLRPSQKPLVLPGKAICLGDDWGWQRVFPPMAYILPLNIASANPSRV